jgi:uncharacterized protein (DUF2141 family)
MHDETGFAKSYRFTLLVLALGVLTPHAQAEPAGAPIQVKVQGLHNDKGKVGCALFASAEGFPSDDGKATQRLSAAIKEGRALCEFTAVPPGSYAVAVIHDENGDGKLEKSFVGKPKEGVGSSRDPKPRFMAPPHFEDAAFKHAAQPSVMTVTVRYL